MVVGRKVQEWRLELEVRRSGAGHGVSPLGAWLEQQLEGESGVETPVLPDVVLDEDQK